MKYNRVPAKHFVQTLAANVNNEKLNDSALREFIRNTLPIVEGGEMLVEDNRPVVHVGDVSDLNRRLSMEKNNANI